MKFLVALMIFVMLAWAGSVAWGSYLAIQDSCQLERIANLLPHWADELERTRDADDLDPFFEVIDEMRVYSNECQVND